MPILSPLCLNISRFFLVLNTKKNGVLVLEEVCVCVLFVSHLRDAVSVSKHGFGAVVHADVVQDTHHYLFMSLAACSAKTTTTKLHLSCTADYRSKILSSY